MSKQPYYVSNFSGGADSSAMTLRLIETGAPLDEVLCCDTTAEFPQLLRHIEKVKKVVEAAGIKFTTLRPEHDFEYYLTKHPVKRKPGSPFYGLNGYGWAANKSRWCTATLKRGLIENYARELRSRYEVHNYIGLAADEGYRLERENNKNPNHHHPLVEWGWTEADALAYCYRKGYDWEGLYEIFGRSSCWCCPLQSYDDLRKLRKHAPDLWAQLLDMDRRQFKSFNHGYTVADLDERFALEDALTAAGHSIKNRAFFTDLKRLLAEEATAEEILQGRTGKSWML